MAPTFDSDKRIASGINRVCDGRQSFVGRPKSPCPWTFAQRAVRSASCGQECFSVPLCFFSNSLELFLKVSQIFVGKFFQIDKFVSSAFQRSNYFVEF